MDPQKDFDFATLKTFSLDSSCRIITSFCTHLVIPTEYLHIMYNYLEIHNSTSLGFRQFYKFLQVELGNFFDLFP